MSTPDVNFNNGFVQTNFVNSLNYIQSKFVPTVTGSPPLGSGLLTGLTSDFISSIVPPVTTAEAMSAFGSFLATYNGSQLPQTTDAFFNAWRNSPQVQAIFTSRGYPPGSSLYNFFFFTVIEPFFLNGVAGLSDDLSIPTAGTGPVYPLASVPSPVPDDPASDWNVLTSANPPVSPAVNIGDQFMAAFSNFLQNYPYVSGNVLPMTTGPTPTLDVNYFFQQWFKFSATTCTLQIAQPPMLSATNAATLGELPSYEQIYYTFHPNATFADFQAALVQYYNTTMSEQGFFLPSQSLSGWVQQNISDYNKTLATSLGIPFGDISADKAAVINRIIKLLIAMISVLQKVGLAQSQQLKFVTSFQNVYVQMQAQMPVFTRGDQVPTAGIFPSGIKSPLGVSSTVADNERTAINTVFNASKTANLSSFRGIQEDAAKQVQANVNQTNDNVNQQSDMARTLLQQLSGLLSSIFR